MFWELLFENELNPIIKKKNVALVLASNQQSLWKTSLLFLNMCCHEFSLCLAADMQCLLVYVLSQQFIPCAILLINSIFYDVLAIDEVNPNAVYHLLLCMCVIITHCN